MPPIQAPTYDAIVYYGISGLAILVAVMFVAMVARGLKKSPVFQVASFVAVFMTLSAVLAATGVLQDVGPPPPMAFMILYVFVFAAVGGLGPLGSRMTSEVPLLWLIGLQMFRLPLELVMHRAYDVGIMPQALSFSGYNFDIVTGIGAVTLFVAMKAKVRIPTLVIWIWNLIGITCLIAIAIIAIAASPMVHAFGTEPEHLNTWVLYYPYVWLPVVMVTIAMTCHIVITRKLLRTKHVIHPD